MDGAQDLGIETRIPSQFFGIDLIAFSIIPTNSMQFTDVRDNDLVSITTKLFVNPDRMGAILERESDRSIS